MRQGDLRADSTDFPYFNGRSGRFAKRQLGNFPNSLDDRAALEAYVFGPDQIGVDLLQIIVDGRVTDLGPAYVVGVTTPPLSDGGGTHYITPAAILGPLSCGTHTVVIQYHVSGAAIGGPPGFGFVGTYMIVVK